jgi:DNA-binding transcriptional regulator YhcF (GntR family)
MRMQPTFDPQTPLFLSIAQWLEDTILAGIFGEGSQVPSITEISVQYNINPATALKGVSLLVESGLLYKKRGMGMFVAAGARAKLLARRQQQFFDDYIEPLIREAERLQLSSEDLREMIERGYDN